MKRRNHILTLAWVAIFCMAAAIGHALSLNHFTQQSRLASGRWVKIGVSQSGMHEITRQELQQMGFDDPMKIKIYGHGGIMMDEVLDANQPDDLHQVPAYRTSEKVCFYASGPLNFVLYGGKAPHYARLRNTNSLLAYYFITDDDGEAVQPSGKSHDSAADIIVTTSLDAYLHEQELFSAAFTGTELLGEELINRHFDYHLINPSDSRVALTSRVALKIVRKIENPTIPYAVSGRFACTSTTAGGSVQVPYTSSASSISGVTGEYIYYYTNRNHDDNAVWFDRLSSANDGSISYTVTMAPGGDSTLLHMAKLDFFIITYNHHNRLAGHTGAQCRLGLSASAARDAVRVEGSNRIMVWDVTEPAAPIQLQTKASGSTAVTFTPGANYAARQYVAFDPTQTLHKIVSHELIDNQNLHAMSVPEMLIITCHELLPQALRVAELHKMQDGMDVAVVDQQHIFNEFSAGMPDPMGVRLLCKMLYDRDPNKFKYLLIFGNVSFDNRGLVTGKRNTIITYSSAVSNIESSSYMNNDFYGYLQDGSGANMSRETLCIGIGHMPVANITEAAHAVDKLYEYVFSTDYGPWRNSYSLWSEKSKEGSSGEGYITWTDSSGNTHSANQLHESQCAGIGRIIDDDAQMMRDMAFVGMYPKDPTQAYLSEDKRTSTEAKRHIKEMLNEGQYFATYVGHAGATMFSSSSMWTTSDVISTPYSRWPIMTTACCDVARIDSDHRGIAELMFHKRDGGAIALYTTTRQVLASMNDDVNRGFVSKMFSYSTTGRMPRLGDAYMASKNYYGDRPNTNKFNFVLLGDPAMQINYPKPLFQVKRINNLDVTTGRSISISGLQKVTIEAHVMQEQAPAQVNTQFNGLATVTLYDIERVSIAQVVGTGTYTGERYPLNYPREKLIQVTGRVTNGVFKASFVVPRYMRSTGQLLLSVYAHQDGTTNMVNGLYRNISSTAFRPNQAVTDTECPVISAMYLNNEHEFTSNATVGSEATLYVSATDNVSFSTQQVGVGRTMRLTLDGGKITYNLAKNYATVSNEGRQLDIALPMSGLTAGKHTLELMVTDVCGNMTSKTITFVVTGEDILSLRTSDIAGSSSVSIELGNYAMSRVPQVDLMITDANGQLVRSVKTGTFPYSWNLTNNSGQRVKPGLYRIYGHYNTEEGYGGTNLIHFVVLPPVSN